MSVFFQGRGLAYPDRPAKLMLVAVGRSGALSVRQPRVVDDRAADGGQRTEVQTEVERQGGDVHAVDLHSIRVLQDSRVREAERDRTGTRRVRQDELERADVRPVGHQGPVTPVGVIEVLCHNVYLRSARTRHGTEELKIV